MKGSLFTTLIFLSILLLAGCNDHVNFEKLQTKTIIETENNINNYLLHMGYKDTYKIFVIAHPQYVENVDSNKNSYEFFSGNGFTPEGPPGSEQSPQPSTTANEDYSTYEKSEIITNFSKTNIKPKVFYISVLIIFDEVSAKERLLLSNTIKRSFLNRNRSDIITIISKSENLRQ